MSTLPEKRHKRVIRKLRHKYRITVMNDESFEEKYSLRLTPLGLFTGIGLLAIALVVVTIFIIAFSPLREYIPGYAGDVRIRREVLMLAEKVDSLEKNAVAKDRLLSNIRGVVEGGQLPENIPTRPSAKVTVETAKLSASADESRFREEVDKEDRYNISIRFQDTRLSAISSYYFFPPMKGKVTTVFNPADRHYGVDIVAPKNEAVKATLDGTVIFAGWTPETGHVLQVQHANNLISVYMHNAVLLRKQGAEVKAGEAIAITGNSGELTSSPHLHFELWFEGKPIDPQDFMVF